MEPADGHPTIQHCIRSFEPYLAANRRTEKPVIHISLNPHPDDVLTDEQLTAIGQEYMEKMGYGNQPYIIYRHEDIGRPHIHIVSLRIDEQGKKIKDYKEWQRSTAVCRELERKYHLLPAEKMERRESLPLTAVDYRKGDIKHQIANVVKPVMQGYKFQSVKEFKALLGLFHVTVEEAHKTIKGKTYHGLVYAATDEKGERTGVAIKSSKIGKSVGYEALQKQTMNCPTSRTRTDEGSYRYRPARTAHPSGIPAGTFWKRHCRHTLAERFRCDLWRDLHRP